MAGVSTPQLAAAVSNAGGLGSLGLGGSSIEQARELIEETRSLTTRPFNANFFCHSPAVRHPACEAAWIKHLEPLFTEFGATPPSSLTESYRSFLADEQGMDMLLATRPPVVSFHFGTPPREQIQRLRAAGIYTMATATSVHEAMAIEEAGLDAIIAQGVEAGGHRGIFDPRAHDELLPTAVLVRLLLQRTQLPVVAAGGVMDGAGVRAVMELGAAAAQMGTAFILCPESAANAGYRSNLQSAKAWSTQLTKAISGRPARGLVNRLIVHGEVPGAPPPAAYPLAFDVAKQLNAAATKQGSHEFGAHWAGQGAPLARAMPAAALVEELVEAIER
jgi:nitronate monooxygenase